MIYIFLSISENKVIYDIYRYKLKKSKISIYYKADYKDYDCEVFIYTYEIWIANSKKIFWIKL